MPSVFPGVLPLCCTPRMPHIIMFMNAKDEGMHFLISLCAAQEMLTDTSIGRLGWELALLLLSRSHRRSSSLVSVLPLLETNVMKSLWQITWQGMSTGCNAGNQGFWRYFIPESMRGSMSRARRGSGDSRSHHWACRDSASASAVVFREPPGGTMRKKKRFFLLKSNVILSKLILFFILRYENIHKF